MICSPVGCTYYNRREISPAAFTECPTQALYIEYLLEITMAVFEHTPDPLTISYSTHFKRPNDEARRDSKRPKYNNEEDCTAGFIYLRMTHSLSVAKLGLSRNLVQNIVEKRHWFGCCKFVSGVPDEIMYQTFASACSAVRAIKKRNHTGGINAKGLFYTCSDLKVKVVGNEESLVQKEIVTEILHTTDSCTGDLAPDKDDEPRLESESDLDIRHENTEEEEEGELRSLKTIQEACGGIVNELEVNVGAAFLVSPNPNEFTIDANEAAFRMLSLTRVFTGTYEEFAKKGIHEVTTRATGWNGVGSLPSPPPLGGSIVDIHNRIIVRKGSHIEWKVLHTDHSLEDDEIMEAMRKIALSVPHVRVHRGDPSGILNMLKDVLSVAGVSYYATTGRVGSGNYVNAIFISSPHHKRHILS